MKSFRISHSKHTIEKSYLRISRIPESLSFIKDFVERVQDQFAYLKAARIKYATCIYDPMISAVKGSDDSMKVVLSTQITGLQIYYTFDGTNPDNFYPEYKGEPLVIPKGTTQINVITYRGGKPVGRQVNCPLSWLRERMKKQ